MNEARIHMDTVGLDDATLDDARQECIRRDKLGFTANMVDHNSERVNHINGVLGEYAFAQWCGGKVVNQGMAGDVRTKAGRMVEVKTTKTCNRELLVLYPDSVRASLYALVWPGPTQHEWYIVGGLTKALFDRYRQPFHTGSGWAVHWNRLMMPDGFRYECDRKATG